MPLCVSEPSKRAVQDVQETSKRPVQENRPRAEPSVQEKEYGPATTGMNFASSKRINVCADYSSLKNA